MKTPPFDFPPLGSRTAPDFNFFPLAGRSSVRGELRETNVHNSPGLRSYVPALGSIFCLRADAGTQIGAPGQPASFHRWDGPGVDCP
jgi:hypothetical protein